MKNKDKLKVVALIEELEDELEHIINAGQKSMDMAFIESYRLQAVTLRTTIERLKGLVNTQGLKHKDLNHDS